MKRKSKRTYCKPEMVTFEIDNEISLVMMTDNNTAPGGPGRGQAAQTDQQLEQNSFESNPFEEQ
ncbi:hypothetical protein [Carboxylicivirga caseinilyticus]|uniref:hypothetical protein n=1 Tax=Carboxylicivirga caseinilyticus TaxID=3417572 RepID=UPI003D341E51|nr:hypothetical protein [Marinilabiliaceae bacterium A049]